MPAAKSDFFFSSARIAPASSRTFPFDGTPRIQRLRPVATFESGLNTVPTSGCPSMIFRMSSAEVDERQMTVWHPPAAASRAAVSFVAIPPVP